jgi:Spy/CpxP family protein refolding chaperone
MSKRILWMVAVVITACALSLNALAQPPGPPPPGGFGGLGELGGAFSRPEFVKMLELTPEQIGTLQKSMQEAGETFWAEARKAFDSGTPPTPEERQQRMEKFMDGIQERTSKILKPEQQTKAKEVMFQLSGGLESPAEGPMGIRMLDVLDLTAAQKEQIRKITAERDAEVRKAMEEVRQDSSIDLRTPEGREKSRALREERTKKYNEQITALLTPEQKAKGEKLTAGIPALREKLGIFAPGQQRQRGQQPGRAQGDGYAPGAQSWQPGQALPNGSASPRREGSFPRQDNPPPAPQ